MAEDSPRTLAKRKRLDDGSAIAVSPILMVSRLPYTLHGSSPEEEGSGSPRSRVVHKFRGLALEGGGGVAQQPNKLDDHQNDENVQGDDGDDPFTRKRQKIVDSIMEDVGAEPPIANPEASASANLEDPPQTPVPASAPESKISLQSAPIQINIVQSVPEPGLASPSLVLSVSDLPASHLPGRPGTPPLKAHTLESSPLDQVQEDAYVSDPVRASLTWHEDEITVYDPEDEDDDGTGLNGIGFKPTPALAHARAQKRRQQLADYRRREETSARRIRRERRHASPIAFSPKLEKKAAARRVRFMGIEEKAVATTG
jgi:hypothetical protein